MENLKDYSQVLLPLDLCGRLSYQIISREDGAAVKRMAAFVDSHDNSHFLQSPRWAGVKEYWKWRGILVYRDGRVAGAMSVLIRPLVLGMSVLYAPRGPICDRNDPFVMSELLVAAEALAAEFGALLMMADPDEAYTNGLFREIMGSLGFREQEDVGFDNIQAQHVFRLALQGKNEEQVFENFCSKTRYNIRLALRKGVSVRKFYGDERIPEAELEAFTRLMQETAQRDHFIARGKEYYRGVFRALGREAVLFMAYLEDTPIAGTIGVFSGRKGWYLYGASSNAHRNAMPNYLLQWEMIRHAMGRYCVFYDFRGVPGDLSEDHPLHGLYRFKKGFGGEYLKFTGLFIYRFRPLLARCFELALKCLRKFRALKLRK